MTSNGKVALITGASGGIGRDLTQVFARQGHDLVIVARSEGKLQQMAEALARQYDVAVTVIAKDLTAAEAPAEILHTLRQKGIQVDVLVNNAGFADYGPFVTSDLDKQLRMMQLNMVTLTHLTHLCLPGMVERGDGRILNVASTAAFMPGPLMAVYYATKAYVLSFSEALANELQGTGVTVTALCPGPTATGFQSRAEMEDSKLIQNGLMDSMQVAQAGYAALMDAEVVHVPGFTNRMQTLLPRFLPRGMVRSIVRNAQERADGH